jgi:hypothetical protein
VSQDNPPSNPKDRAEWDKREIERGKSWDKIEAERLKKQGIKEEFGGEGLTLGKEYSVLEPGMNEWLEGLEYLGFDRNEGEHVFRDAVNVAPGDNVVFFIKVTDEEVDGSVKESFTEDKDWIQKAIKRPGALHRELGVPKGKDIPKGKINKAISRLKKKDKDDKAKGTQLPAGDERELRQLNLAKTLSKFNEGKLAERVFKKLREEETTEKPTEKAQADVEMILKLIPKIDQKSEWTQLMDKVVPQKVNGLNNAAKSVYLIKKAGEIKKEKE